MALGTQARKALPRQALATGPPRTPAPTRWPCLVDQAAPRLANLVPIRHGRMSVSAFAFYRGSALVMASDLATQPNTGLTGPALRGRAHRQLRHVRLTGADAALRPQRLRRDPPRTVRVGRQAACRLRRPHRSLQRVGFFSAADMARLCASAYRESMRMVRRHAARSRSGTPAWMSPTSHKLADSIPREQMLARVERTLAGAEPRTNLQAMGKLTTVVRRSAPVRGGPPLLMRIGAEQAELLAGDAMLVYRSTLVSDRAALLDQYQVVDVAHKVVGVGSVGTRCYVLLLQGVDGGDPLMLQFKEASASVLEPFTGHRSTTTTGPGWSLGSASCRQRPTSSSAGPRPPTTRTSCTTPTSASCAT